MGKSIDPEVPTWLGYNAESWMSMSSDLLVGAAAIVTGIVAWRGLSSWKTSFKSKAKHQASAQLLSAGFQVIQDCYSYCIQAEKLCTARVKGSRPSSIDFEMSKQYKEKCDASLAVYRSAYWEADSVLPDSDLGVVHLLDQDIQSLYNLTIYYFSRLRSAKADGSVLVEGSAKRFYGVVLRAVIDEQEDVGFERVRKNLVTARSHLRKYLLR